MQTRTTFLKLEAADEKYTALLPFSNGCRDLIMHTGGATDTEHTDRQSNLHLQTEMGPFFGLRLRQLHPQN